MSDPRLTAGWARVFRELFPPDRLMREKRVDIAITGDGGVRGEQVRGALSDEATPIVDLDQVPAPDGVAYDTLADVLADVTGLLGILGIKFIVQQASSLLTNEQALGALATGLLKSTTTTGVLSIATPGTDYTVPGAAMFESGVQTSTPVAGNTSTVPGANVWCFDFFTLPTTEKIYRITEIEWKNGAAVAGTIYSAVYQVNADPPTSANVALVAWGSPATQAGTSATQTAGRVASAAIRGGSILAVGFASTSGTSAFGATTVAAENHKKAMTAGSPPLVDNTAWTSDTDAYYAKASFRGYS